jgi:peptidoglycan/xylan/chitin deacetylase (PgdA/CDA1 family)
MKCELKNSRVFAKGFGRTRMPLPWEPIGRYIRRNVGRMLFQKQQMISLDQALISFSFDDFPRSAFLAGGDILKRHGLSATYYAALGLLGRDSPSGEICSVEDLREAFNEGHELGCHTFAHCDSWKTDARRFEESVIQNGAALSELIPGARFKSFSYPISLPHPMTKRAVSRHFLCCRGGGQTFNMGKADLNQLSAYFLEKTNGNLQPVKDLVDRNKEARGWIIFATHDVSPHPGPYGCTPEFFEDVVNYAVSSGARILPVVKALNTIQATDSSA